jgi:two-component system sensor histidine kinase KdpD
VRRRPWVVASVALLAATVLMLVVRERLDKVHVALIYLLIVLLGSAAGGRILGLTLSFAAFLSFNFWFLPPYHTLGLTDPFDWLVLLSFLVTGVVAAELLNRLQREAYTATRRAGEVDRLATIGAETLSAGRADDALAAIAHAMQTTLGVQRCEIYRWHDGQADLACRAPTESANVDAPSGDVTVTIDEQVRWVAERASGVRELTDGAIQRAEHGALRAMGSAASVRALVLPLRVYDRTVGVVRLVHHVGIAFDATQQRYLDALSYYAALSVERVRLVAEVERAAAEREADRLKDSLMATVSHDLRTPLTTIRGIAHEIATDGDARAYIITEEVDRLNRFIADFLDLSRLSANAIPLNLALVAAEDVLGAALQRIDGIVAGRVVNASVEPGDPILIGRLDFSHTVRILCNLLENALKYAPPDQPVDVAASRDREWLQFAVADRGPGIAAREHERVFAAFYRPPGSSSDVGATGLGLAIARGLAEAQGGTLHLSARDGGGSVFTLRVPAADFSAIEQTRSHGQDA